jgi:HAE1 family hydrophobic/amphiphilic exporter-1
MALPFSFSGAFLALLVGGQSLNLYSMIGLVLLMGIVKKNSILLVDFTNQKRDEEKLPVRKALAEACPTRLRPILMTSFATIAGALPAALSFGPGAEVRKPMAVAVIGGVLISTLLTLYVVPCVYSLLAKFDKREKRATAGTEESGSAP